MMSKVWQHLSGYVIDKAKCADLGARLFLPLLIQLRFPMV